MEPYWGVLPLQAKNLQGIPEWVIKLQTSGAPLHSFHMSPLPSCLAHLQMGCTYDPNWFLPVWIKTDLAQSKELAIGEERLVAGVGSGEGQVFQKTHGPVSETQLQCPQWQ